MFTAMRGQGAHMNGKRMSVSGCTSISSAIIHTELGYNRQPEAVGIAAPHFENAFYEMYHRLHRDPPKEYWKRNSTKFKE